MTKGWNDQLAAALGQIADPARRASVTAVVDRASQAARAYLLIVLAQAIAVTAVCSAVFYLLDLPAPFVLGLLVGWLSAIPIWASFSAASPRCSSP